MISPQPSRDLRRELDELMPQLQEAVAGAIRGTDTRMALPPGAEAALADFHEPLPAAGGGAAATLERLLELCFCANGRSFTGEFARPKLFCLKHPGQLQMYVTGVRGPLLTLQASSVSTAPPASFQGMRPQRARWPRASMCRNGPCGAVLR